jgi:GntR family transcriptional regulator/MocR family aminotransferase
MPLQLGIPALDAFPRKVWSRLAARRVRTTLPADLGYGDACGELALRQAIAAYLLVSRGIECGPDQVFITTGYCASLELAASVLLQRGDTVWIEDPCYSPTRTVLERAALIAHPVAVDEEGLDDSAGRRSAPDACMAVVTPSHQAPLCVSMTVSRRLALLDWASRAKAWVFEDDYDGEFHYSGPTLPALKSLDARDRVIYAGSFSKVLFPALSLGYVVAPKTAAPLFEQAVHAAPNRSARVLQATVADFMAGGHFARHLKRMRLLYARRRGWLVEALRDVVGEQVYVDQTRGGMHLIVRVRSRVGDRTLAGRARQAGLNCQALSERYAKARRQNRGVLMGFTNVTSPAEAARIARRLRDAFAID